MKNAINIVFSCVLVFALMACQPSKRRADISSIAMDDVRIQRFDSAFWAIDRADIAAGVLRLDSLYPEITPVYLENVVEFGSVGDTLTAQTLAHFFEDTAVMRLYTDVETRFADVSAYERRLTDAFKRVRCFFPDKSVPHCCVHVSGLNQNVVIGDGFISVSIDNYMGSDYPLYAEVGIYSYLRQNMRPEKVVPDIMTAWVLSEFPFVPRTGELQEEMIYRGKILYLVSLLLPDEPENNLIGYTPEQWAWCQRYEHDMWMVLVGGKHLFSHDAMLRNRYLNDGPFTKPFTQESPGRAGVYVGWQIVEQYMRQHREVSPLELMTRPADEIVRGTRYNP